MLSEWKSAQRNLEFWVQHGGGSYPAVKLLDRMLQELPQIAKNHEEKEALLQGLAVGAIVERWALDCRPDNADDDEHHPNLFVAAEKVDPTEMSDLLGSCQRHGIPVDASALELVHRVTAGEDVQLEFSQSMLDRQNL